MAYKTQIFTLTRTDGIAFTNAAEAYTFIRAREYDFTDIDKAKIDGKLAAEGEIIDDSFVVTWTMTNDFDFNNDLEIPGLTATYGAAGEVDTHPDLD
jgi:hypothetical protein|tara:strand:- start:21 stop:311 length:291 start_codon:yes stop_codon:yes gene_type:complete